MVEAEGEPIRHPGIAELVEASRVRAGLFLPQFEQDPASGQMRGHGTGYVGIALAKMFAARCGIEAQIIGYQTPSSALAALRDGACDIAFMGIEPGRQALLDFTPPMFLFDYTYLVGSGVAVDTIASADCASMRIVMVDNHASALALRPLISKARLISAELPEEAFAILRKGDADIFACPRDVLLDYADKLPGSRVLDEAFGKNRVGISMQKGRAGLREVLSAFVEDAKASGTMARIIAEGQLRGFTVAPPAA